MLSPMLLYYIGLLRVGKVLRYDSQWNKNIIKLAWHRCEVVTMETLIAYIPSGCYGNQLCGLTTQGSYTDCVKIPFH